MLKGPRKGMERLLGLNPASQIRNASKELRDTHEALLDEMTELKAEVVRLHRLLGLEYHDPNMDESAGRKMPQQVEKSAQSSAHAFQEGSTSATDPPQDAHGIEVHLDHDKKHESTEDPKFFVVQTELLPEAKLRLSQQQLAGEQWKPFDEANREKRQQPNTGEPADNNENPSEAVVQLPPRKPTANLTPAGKPYVPELVPSVMELVPKPLLEPQEPPKMKPKTPTNYIPADTLRPVSKRLANSHMLGNSVTSKRTPGL